METDQCRETVTRKSGVPMGKASPRFQPEGSNHRIAAGEKFPSAKERSRSAAGIASRPQHCGRDTQRFSITG